MIRDKKRCWTFDDLFPLLQISGTQGHLRSLRSRRLVDEVGKKTMGAPPQLPPHRAPKQLLLFTQLLRGLGSHKNSASKTKPTQRDTKTNLGSRITKYLSARRRPPKGSERPSPTLALRVWGHLWRLGPWAGVAAMTYNTNLRGYSSPWSLQPSSFDVVYCYGIWPHSTARRRDWIVLFRCTSVCLPGRINDLLTALQSGCFFCFFFSISDP